MDLHRYLLFSGPPDSHAGGWGDFTHSFPAIAQAIAAGHRTKDAGHTWWHVIDARSGYWVADQTGEE